MNPTLVVVRKELKELFRDRRVRTNAIVMPMFIMLLMLSLFGFISGVGDKKNQVVHVIKADNQLVKKLKEDKIQVLDVASKAEAESLIREGKARVVLEFEPDFDAKVAAGQTTPVTAYIDPQLDTGKIALGNVAEDLEKINAATAAAVLAKSHIPATSLAPAILQKKEIKVGKSNTSDFLIGFLPYLIVIYAFYGAFGSASDTVAGEKEKMTLETLLIAPVGRSQIAMGKFLSLATICFLSSFSALMGVVIAGSSHLPMYSKLFEKGLGLDGGQLGMMLLVLLPTVAFFASMLLAVSAYAKNTREAQSYMGIISLVVLMPAIFSQIIGLTDLGSKWWIRLIPVLNTSVTLRDALQGKSNALGIALTIAVGAVLAFIGIRIAVYLFKREEVLTRV
jgi:sodium transport system permease protein